MKRAHIDYEITLADLQAKGASDTDVAAMLGINRNAVRQMRIAKRAIYLRKIDGKWHYAEIKDWKRETGQSYNWKPSSRNAPKRKERPRKVLKEAAKEEQAA